MAWRQILITMRTSRYAMIIAGGIGMVFTIMAVTIDRSRMGNDFLTLMAALLMAYLTFIFAMQLPWGFRGDIGHMECLKALPVAPLAVAAGELAGGVCLLSAIQLVVMTAALATGGNPLLVLAVLAFLVPFDVLMLAMSNTLFLIYPVRFAQGTSADFQMMGRMMLFMLLHFLLLIPTLGIPAAFGGLAYVLSGFNVAAFAGVAWVLLVAELPLWLVLLAAMFSRFDPGTETPP